MLDAKVGLTEKNVKYNIKRYFINFNTNITVHKFELVHYTRFGGMLEKRAGYFEDYENGYLGNRWRQLHRTEIKKENDRYKIDAGFLTSKDAGEQYLINGNLPYQNSYLQSTYL